jgi:hypothetical protein
VAPHESGGDVLGKLQHRQLSFPQPPVERARLFESLHSVFRCVRCDPARICAAVRVDAQLAAEVEHDVTAERTASAFGLLPADRGANVVLLRPFDDVVWERTMVEDRVSYVSPSQVAVDCLTGNGRMPSEGEALLTWMVGNEEEWRMASVKDLPAAEERRDASCSA